MRGGKEATLHKVVNLQQPVEFETVLFEKLEAGRLEDQAAIFATLQ